MGLSSEMKNLSEELLASFKQRIKDNEDLVNEVQKTLDGFRNDHQQMAAVLNANAMALRNGLADGEKERLHNYNGLMSQIHQSIASIQTEVMGIQTSTFNMINEFSADRTQMAADLNKFFAQERSDRMENEKTRIEDFNALMKSINDDIKSINDEVSAILKDTNDMIARFEKEHLDMSAELRAELGKNLAERVEYTRAMLNGFQMRLAEISKENQEMAQKLRNDLANGEAERLGQYKVMMEEIHFAIKEICEDVQNIQKETAGLIGYYANERSEGAAEWLKIQAAMAQVRNGGFVAPVVEVSVIAEKEEVKIEAPVEVVVETPVATEPVVMMTLEEKVLDYINKHPNGVKVSEMEAPLGETRMKLGYTARTLLDEGKVQKVDNVYFAIK